MKKSLLFLASALAVVVLTACGSASENISASDTKSGIFLIVSDRDGDSEIFVMNADGSKKQQLTDNDVRDLDPAWSPDGKQILFVQGNETSFRIHLMEADGSRENLISAEDSQTYSDDGPAWSPDGEEIAFFSDRDGDSEIFVVNVDGSGVRQLTDNDVADLYPTWSPDGEEIAFFGKFEEDLRMHRIDRNGSGLVMLEYFDLWFDWKNDPAIAN